jgi:hypothetical protein
MATQSFAKDFTSPKEKLEEAKNLMKGLSFRETYYVCDGYESWESSRDNLDAFVELIERARASV